MTLFPKKQKKIYKNSSNYNVSFFFSMLENGYCCLTQLLLARLSTKKINQIINKIRNGIKDDVKEAKEMLLFKFHFICEACFSCFVRKKKQIVCLLSKATLKVKKMLISYWVKARCIEQLSFFFLEFFTF